jgi:catechol 2,3-dioxygenase-like lactoylglutathione lyase family enzyme
MPAVRYIVSDIAQCVAFYRDMLSFKVEMDAAPQFAALSREGLTLYLNVPGAGSAGKAGGNPEPGGWNRFQVETEDLDATIADLRGKGASFCGEVASGAGGRQILLLDPSGNVVELFERAARSS